VGVARQPLGLAVEVVGVGEDAHLLVLRQLRREAAGAGGLAAAKLGAILQGLQLVQHRRRLAWPGDGGL
jgi:hypothetical protein